MQSSAAFNYEDRYGKRGNKGWIIPAAALAIFGLIWILWAGLFHSDPTVRSTLYSFSITGEKEVTIRYGIERKNGSQTIVCTLVAYDFDKNIVGQFDDRFEPGSKKVQRDTPVATRSAPVSAALSNCRTA
jgi:hypothetical protein